MSINQKQKVEFFKTVAFMEPKNGEDESMRINHIDDTVDSAVIYATGEDSGEEYCLDISEIDLNDYHYYQLSLIHAPGAWIKDCH